MEDPTSPRRDPPPPARMPEQTYHANSGNTAHATAVPPTLRPTPPDKFEAALHQAAQNPLPELQPVGGRVTMRIKKIPSPLTTSLDASASWHTGAGLPTAAPSHRHRRPAPPSPTTPCKNPRGLLRSHVQSCITRLCGSSDFDDLNVNRIKLPHVCLDHRTRSGRRRRPHRHRLGNRRMGLPPPSL